MKKRRKFKVSLPRSAQMVGPHRWYYVEPFGLCVLQETLSSTGAYVLTTAPKIPWRHVERALRICKRWKRERPK